MNVNKVYVERLILDIERSIEAILSYSSKPYEALSDAERYAVRYNIVVVAEAVIALALHAARRSYGEEPEMPVQALSILRDKGLITSTDYDDLVRLYRLRNLLVHRYWMVDDERIYRSVKSDFRSVRSFAERLREACR
ncbi:DUF86 domain-containing protein [Candidatus Bathyarchaeota archaeon]|nr:DUF86 domain-containing protein [Candidatus Bathyarchaeota archaeon]